MQFYILEYQNSTYVAFVSKPFFSIYQRLKDYGGQDEMREDWCFHLYSETCIKSLKVIKISITEIDFICKQKVSIHMYIKINNHRFNSFLSKINNFKLN